MNLLRLIVPTTALAVVMLLVIPPAKAADDDLALHQAIVDIHANAPAEVLGFDPREVGLTVTKQDLHAT